MRVTCLATAEEDTYEPTLADVTNALNSCWPHWADQQTEVLHVTTDDNVVNAYSAVVPEPLAADIAAGRQTSYWQNRATITCSDDYRRNICLLFDPSTAQDD